MKYSLFAVAMILASAYASAQTQSARVYDCVAQQDVPKHLDTYWGDETADLKSAQASAMQQCLADSSANSNCQVSECWSSLPNGDDQQAEATN